MRSAAHDLRFVHHGVSNLDLSADGILQTYTRTTVSISTYPYLAMEMSSLITEIAFCSRLAVDRCCCCRLRLRPCGGGGGHDDMSQIFKDPPRNFPPGRRAAVCLLYTVCVSVFGTFA